MTIDLLILIQMIIAAILGSLIYLIIGIIPGTDETSVLAPIVLILLKLEVNPLIVLVFFIAAMISLVITDSIPTALTAIPGGVMSTPLVEASSTLKEKGKTTSSLRKMTLGSLIGTIIAFFVSLIFIGLFSYINKYIDLAAFVSKNSSLIFFAGAILLAILTKEMKSKIISLLIIIPFAVFTGLLRTKFEIPLISFFLAITTGPLLYNLLSLIFPKVRKRNTVYGNMNIHIILDHDLKFNFKKIISKKEFKLTSIASLIASTTFFLSPVGMTLLIGDTVTNSIEDEEEKAFSKVTVMNGIANASYLSGIMLSLLVFKFPISPAALGPAGPLFDPNYGILNKLSNSDMIVAIIIGIVLSLIIVIAITLKYAEKMTFLVFKYVSHEALLALLFSLVFLIVFIDSGILGVLLILIVSLVSGFLHKKGVSYGVLFMTLYASTFILGWF